MPHPAQPRRNIPKNSADMQRDLRAFMAEIGDFNPSGDESAARVARDRARWAKDQRKAKRKTWRQAARKKAQKIKAGGRAGVAGASLYGNLGGQRAGAAPWGQRPQGITPGGRR